jgi:hypothetical protein
MTEFKIEHNLETGEILEIPLTEKEIKELEKIRVESAKELEAFQKAKSKAEENKAAILARLGLTEDELKTILG